MAALPAQRNKLKRRTRLRRLARIRSHPPNLNQGNPTIRSLHRRPATEGLFTVREIGGRVLHRLSTWQGALSLAFH